MSGAAVIAANTAITMGSGLVYLMTDTNGNDSKLYPEIIKNEINFNDLNTFSHSELVDFSEKIIDKYKNIDIWVIGPGLGNSTGILSLIEILVDKLLKNNKIVILDADGLRVININKSYNKNLILTPHIYEFTKLVKLDLEDVTKSLEENPIEFINDISKKLNCIIHLKYFPSITTLGNEAFLNDNYNSGLSKAGSGDMLSGLIAGLLAQTKFHTETKAQEKREVNTMQIVALASFIQTYLANLYTQKYNKESMRASDLIELIKEL